MDVFDGEDREHQSRVIFGGPVDLFVAFGHFFCDGMNGMWMGSDGLVVGLMSWWVGKWKGLRLEVVEE